jgi:hypothetical protein
MSVGDRRHCVIFELTSVEATPAAPLADVELVEFVTPALLLFVL